MTALDILTATATAVSAPTRVDPIKLFLDADLVVQAVMVGLILASIWSWMIIIGFTLRMRGVRSRGESFEGGFWKADEFDEYMKAHARKDVPLARVAGSGMAEWRRSTKGGVKDKEGMRQRLALAMESQVAEESDSLASRLTFLATVGSVAPFVGLFGTVWGIMNSFFQIGAQQNSSLAVVAPGISEALFATAIGLFAAIPAVIAYNRFSQSVNSYEAKMQRFADRFHSSLSRQLERL